MNIEAVISQVTSRKTVNQKGQEVVYYDAFCLDLEPDPLKRYPGQISFKPTLDEIKEKGIVEGAKYTIHILGFQDLRNGVPVCQVKLEPYPGQPAKKAA